MSSLKKNLNILQFIFLLALLIILFSPVYYSLFHDWFFYNNNSHGILIPFISLYFIWRSRPSINLEEAEISYTGLSIFLIGLLLYLIGYAGRIDILSRIAFVTAIIGFVFYNFGYHVFKKIAFPLCFLYLMIPIPVSIESVVSFRLQLWATQISSSIIETLSIPVVREGNILHFSNCSLEVAEACSGIRSLMAYFTLACIFGYLMKGSFLRRSLLIPIAVPLAFLVNIVRVVGTGLLADHFGPKVAMGFLHEFSGIIVFILGFFIFLIIFMLIEKKDESPGIKGSQIEK
jgi:exosortase